MIKPTRGFVLIEPDKAEEKTAGGLFVPETAQEKPQKGTIIAVGEARLEDMKLLKEVYKIDEWSKDTFVIGKRVYYKKWAGDEITEDGKTLKFVRFEDILAVIE